MKLYDAGLTILIIIIVVSAVGLVSVKFLGDDNPIEEVAEDVIQVETGAKIDLTPNTHE